MSIKYSVAAAVLALGITTGLPALADDTVLVNGETSMFSALDTVSTDELGMTRGMHIEEEHDESIGGGLENNYSSIGDDVVMTNTIDTSFNGASGIATVIQNVGSNVIIQTSTMVTVNYNN